MLNAFSLFSRYDSTNLSYCYEVWMHLQTFWSWCRVPLLHRPSFLSNVSMWYNLMHCITRYLNTVSGRSLKPLHNIGKVYVNASILYKNQEIRNKTNLSKVQLISLFLLQENSKNAFSIFVFVLMAGIHIRQKYFKGSFLPSLSLYHVSYV